MSEKEYIERENLKKSLAYLINDFDNDGVIYGLKVAIQVLATQPTADVAEVVRCRNCVALKASVDGAYCDRLSSTWDKCYVRFDDFCSYGERKNDD